MTTIQQQPIGRILTRDPVYDTYTAGDDVARHDMITSVTTAYLQAAYHYADVLMTMVTYRIRQHYPTAGRLSFHADASEIYQLEDCAGRVIANPDQVEDFEHAPSSAEGVDWESTLRYVCDYIAAAWEAAGEGYFATDGGFLDFTMPPA